MKNLYTDLYALLHTTAASAGMEMPSDDKCCRLLAWLYSFGGECEATILNLKLNVDIGAALDRLNLHDGERSNAALFPALQRYVTELEDYINQKSDEPITEPKWLTELANEYKIAEIGSSNS
jgi:hypothetical protein